MFAHVSKYRDWFIHFGAGCDGADLGGLRWAVGWGRVVGARGNPVKGQIGQKRIDKVSSIMEQTPEVYEPWFLFPHDSWLCELPVETLTSRSTPFLSRFIYPLPAP